MRTDRGSVKSWLTALAFAAGFDRLARQYLREMIVEAGAESERQVIDATRWPRRQIS